MISDNNSNNSTSTAFPAVDVAGELGYQEESGVTSGDGDRCAPSNSVDKLLELVPQSVWQPNAVVRRHRQKANLYWLMLLIGYAIYIALVSGFVKVFFRFQGDECCTRGLEKRPDQTASFGYRPVCYLVCTAEYERSSCE